MSVGVGSRLNIYFQLFNYEIENLRPSFRIKTNERISYICHQV